MFCRWSCKGKEVFNLTPSSFPQALIVYVVKLGTSQWLLIAEVGQETVTELQLWVMLYTDTTACHSFGFGLSKVREENWVLDINLLRHIYTEKQMYTLKGRHEKNGINSYQQTFGWSQHSPVAKKK